MITHMAIAIGQIVLAVGGFALMVGLAVVLYLAVGLAIRAAIDTAVARRAQRRSSR